MAETATKIYVNLVRFVPLAEFAADPIPVALDGDYALKCGVDPVLNTVLMDGPALEALMEGDNPGVDGELRFYFDNHPDAGAPSLVIGGLRIIDAEIEKAGVFAGYSERQPIRYRVSLADGRHKFIPPRGGMLRQGTINAAPFNTASDKDRLGNPIKGNVELIGMALAACGLRGVAVPQVANDYPPPANIEWRGNHAPTELKKLLEHAYLVLVPKIDGTFTVERPGGGSLPSIPAERALTPMPRMPFDRRGRTVVITSAPQQAMNTQTLSGPNAETWEFVARDRDGYWKPLEQLKLLADAGYNAQQIIQNQPLGPSGERTQNSIPEAFRQQLLDDLYKCVRLNPFTHNQGRILRQIYAPPSGAGGAAPVRDIEVEAKIAKQRQYTGADGNVLFGIWFNSDNFVRIKPTALFQPITPGGRQYFTILQFGQRLGKVTATDPNIGSTNAERDFAPLADGDLKITFTQEVLNDDGTPGYFTVGYTQEFGGGITKLSDGEVETAINDPDGETLFVRRPDLQIFQVNGSDQNRRDLEDVAAALAPRYLAGSGPGAMELGCRGYLPANLSGQVSEIRISQEGLMMTFHVNTWFLPSGAFLAKQLADKDGTAGGGASYPMQSAVETQRIAQGAGGAEQPAVMLNPGAAAAGGGQAPDLLDVVGKEAGGGWYKGVLASASIVADPSKNLQIGSNSGVAVLAGNLGEHDRSIHRVPIGLRIPCVSTSVRHTDGRAVVLFYYDPDPLKNIRYHITGGTNNPSLEMRRTVDPNTDVPNTSWEKIVDFKPCPPPA